MPRMQSEREATSPLWRAAQAFRAASLIYVIAIQVSSDQDYERPGLAWSLTGLLLLWSGVAIVGFTLKIARGRLVVLDQIMVTALMLSSYAVADPSWWNHHQTLPTTLWAANAVVSAGLWGGPWWGMASGALVSTTAMIVSGELSNLWLDAALPVLLAVGGALGIAASSARRAQNQLAEAVRLRAATAERERLGREVHDGVLQVLALMRRRGASAEGELRDLALLAGEQERALRTLLAGRRPTAAPGEHVEVVAGLHDLEALGVRVSAPADPVLLPAPTGEPLVGAARAAVTNALQHAGDEADVFVLVEDLPDEVVVTVRDDGRGIEAGRVRAAETEGRMGIAQSIRGRMTDIGGEARLTTSPGEGVEWELAVRRDQPEEKS